MAINTSAIEAFVDNIGQAGNTLNVDNLGLSRTVSKKFAKMLGGVKSKTATVGGTQYELTKAGAVSMIQTLDEGDSLSPSYNGATLDVNTDVTKPTVVLGGTFASNSFTEVDGQQVQQKSAQVVTGKSVALYDATISDKTSVTIKSSGPIVAEGCVLDNRDGGIAKAANGSNSALKVYDCNPASVTMKDIKVYASSSAGAGALYNGLEIWGGGNTRVVNIENCQLLGKMTNNALSVYGVSNSTVINIKNCWFDTVSNVLRISNDYNSTNVTVNFENCVIEHWEGENATASAKNDWAGLILCQDYKAASAEAAETDNRFGPTKLTINIKNCRGPKGPIEFAEGETAADYCQTGLGTQLCYVYRDKGGLVQYDADKYPVLNVEYTAAPTVVKGSIPA